MGSSQLANLSNFFVMSAAEVKTEVSAEAKEPRRRNDNVILLHLPTSDNPPKIYIFDKN